MTNTDKLIADAINPIKLAKALKVAVNALNRIGLYSDLGGKFAGEALTEIERIANS